MTTARELVDRIMAHAGADGAPAPPRPSRRDTFKVGDPDTTITGVATTGMSTWDVLRRAHAEGRNLIITHEATFFRDDDIADFLEGDPIYAAKRAFAESNGLVVWRNHDLSHRLLPDQMLVGLMRQLQWTADSAEPLSLRRLPVVTLPAPMTLAALTHHVVTRAGIRSYRVNGDPEMMVRRVAVGVGFAYPNFLLDAGVDVLVGGESAEGSDSMAPNYDLTAFAQDSTALGRPRGLILMGHMGTEDIGMQVMAEWIQAFTPEVTVAYLPAGEPFGAPL